MNGVVAGIIVAGIGEVSAYVFEQIYLGNKSVDDVDWVKIVLESKLSGEAIKKATEII